MKDRITYAWEAGRDFWHQLLLAVDQLANVLLGLLAIVRAAWTGRAQAVNFADETLSAHAWRAAVRGKWFGLIFRPLIDVMFCWQKSDPTIKDAADQIITGHCERAYHKERLRRQLPPEYRL